MKLLILIFLISIRISASNLDYVDGKLIQIVNLGLGDCGSEGILIIQTKRPIVFIYEYVNFKQTNYERYLNLNVRVTYVNSTSNITDCNAGIKLIRSL